MTTTVGTRRLPRNLHDYRVCAAFNAALPQVIKVCPPCLAGKQAAPLVAIRLTSAISEKKIRVGKFVLRRGMGS